MYEKINRCFEIYIRIEVLISLDYENRVMYMEREIFCVGFLRCIYINLLGIS